MIFSAKPISSAGRILVGWTLVVAAAGLALAAGGLVLHVASLRTENAELDTQRALAEVALKTAETQLKERSLVAEAIINDLSRQLRARDDFPRLKVTALVPPAGEAAGLRAVVVWDPTRQTGLLSVQDLPANDDQHDYQFWIKDRGVPDPIRGCVFHVTPGVNLTVPFTLEHPSAQATGFTVSLEKRGGSAKIEGPTVLHESN